MHQHNNVQLKSDKAQIQLALQAIKKDPNLSIRRAAAISNISQKTLGGRNKGKLSRRNCTSNAMRILPTEEEVIVQHILDLDARGSPPRLADVKAMVDSLLAERGQAPIGKNWPSMFVQRQDKLCSNFY